jgi:hypothetical protein
MAEDSSGYRCIADIIMETLNDKKWARKIYKKTTDKAKSVPGFCKIAGSIINKYDNGKWVIEKEEGKG